MNVSRQSIVAVALASLIAFLLAIGIARHRTSTPDAGRQAGAAKVGKKMPTLYCDFYNFMHNATVVSFFFSVADAAGPKPVFSELYVVEPDGTRTTFGGSDAPSPIWAYALDDGTPMISSVDGVTQIKLYGWKPNASGVFWIEAGIRSVSYKNLEGKCRQAYLGPGG